MKLHLNPDDHETLGTQAAAIAHDLAQLAPADVVADPSVDRGGCRVVTEFGEIDQRIQSQLARIEQELT